MLFDLTGRRRRVVQVTYVGLAVLMGGGFLLFNIGGNFSDVGGLLDAFKGNGSQDTGSQGEGLVKSAEKRLRTNPKDEAALKNAARGYYQLAGAKAGDNRTLGEAAKPELRKATGAWDRYLALDPKKVDASLAALMVQAYGQFGLNKPDKAATAAEILAEARSDSTTYIQLVRYATQAGQTRKADLAAGKALELASPGERSLVRKRILRARTPATAAGGQGANPASPGQQP